MVGEGILTIIKYMHNVDTEANIHAYLTKIAQHAFIQYNKKQKNHSTIKDKLCEFDCESEEEYISKALDYQIFNR
jgi:DNA-directed RNA polymerase specialized sigma24 family protein